MFTFYGGSNPINRVRKTTMPKIHLPLEHVMSKVSSRIGIRGKRGGTEIVPIWVLF